MKESFIQKIARLYLTILSEKMPITHWRIPVERRVINGQSVANHLKGFPDLLICYRGFFVGAEAKSKTGRQSEDQKSTESVINEAEGSYFLFHSLDGLIAGLQEVGKLHLKPSVASQDLVCMFEQRDRLLRENKRIQRILDQIQASGVASEIDSLGGFEPPF